ncbi:MAG TPA: DUF3179 domain-containing (seleno)protein [Bacteroidia bacterium]|nr:DUF3179 domain-containing (seleno)protein [Bacteroidia bacterium]
MKKTFYRGIALFILLEFLNNYLLMRYPGSQRLNSIAFSHGLYQNKIYLEIVLGALILISCVRLFRSGKVVVPMLFIILGIASYVCFNFIITAERFFQQPKHFIMTSVAQNKVDTDKLVIGITVHGISKAYPVHYIMYHHQVPDTLGSQPIIVTYCPLCRTGRVYDPHVNGKHETFRLVGVNHSNAMIEDFTTKSWWSQETGVCIAGKLKGTTLTEIPSYNMTLKQWIGLHPNTTIMQPDPAYLNRYRTVDDYRVDNGNETGDWKDQTFVVGVIVDSSATAYQWNQLVKNRVINDTVGSTSIMVVVANDNKSFFVFENPSTSPVIYRSDTLVVAYRDYMFSGVPLTEGDAPLKPVRAYREKWFSWKYAHPQTTRYSANYLLNSEK